MSPTALDFPAVRRYLDQRFLCAMPSAGNRVALTFDDGPSPRNTEALLDVLDKHGVHATFFLAGMRASAYPHVVRRAAEAGHDIGNHTTHHLPLNLLPTSIIKRQIEGTNQRIVDITGQRPEFMRPPFGWFNDRVVEAITQLDMRPVIGSVYPRDSRRPGVQTIVQRVVDRLSPGAIIILHDGGWHPRADRRQTVEAVDRLLGVLRTMHFEAGSVNELLRSSK